MLLNTGNITLVFFSLIPNLSRYLAFHFKFLYRSAYRVKEKVMLAMLTEISQYSWHYISYFKVAFLCKYISREFNYSVYPPLLLPRDTSLFQLLNKSSSWDKSHESRVSDPKPWRIRQRKCHLVSPMAPLISQRVLFLDIYGYMWLS